MVLMWKITIACKLCERAVAGKVLCGIVDVIYENEFDENF